jgi:hypothetical protein
MLLFCCWFFFLVDPTIWPATRSLDRVDHRVGFKTMPSIIFLLPFFFSLLHLKMCVGLAKLQGDPQSFNCIEFDLVVFQFHQLTFDFLWFFLSNLIIILLIPIYFAFNIFSNWILFFDFIHNHFILILFFCWTWSSFLWLKFLFIWSSFHDWLFFLQFHPPLLNFIEFSYHIWCLFFFIMLLKLGPGVDLRHISGHILGRMIRNTAVNQFFFYHVRSKNNII